MPEYFCLQSWNLTDLSTYSFSCFQKCKTIETKLDPLPGKFIWDNKAIDCYTTNIQNSHVKQRLEEFVNDKQIDCNSAVEKFNAILCDTALLSTKFVQKKIMNRPIKKNKKPWFSDSCHDLHTTVKKYCLLVNKFPDNGSYRKSFYSFKSKLRRK